MQASSSRRETRPENRHPPAKKPTGCMSGILHLLSRHHHNRSRKRLPSGKKNNGNVLPAKPAPPPPDAGGEKRNPNPPTNDQVKAIPSEKTRRRSCETPRSPTLPQELRRPCSAASPDSPRRPSALVARLMGLEETPVSSPESAAEKRRKLLGALEKCDEDLRALKRIIEAVQIAEAGRKSTAAVAVAVAEGGVVNVRVGRKFLDGDDIRMEVIKCSEANSEQPSPVSVLDALSSPIYRSDTTTQRGSLMTAVRSRPSGGHRRTASDAGENSLFFRRITIEELPPRAAERRGHEHVEEFELARVMDGGRRRWRRRRSRALGESVEEVWEDGVCEERWEFGRVGLGLEGEIFGDLVEEVVVEMLACFYRLAFSMGTCRKRLCF